MASPKLLRQHPDRPLVTGAVTGVPEVASAVLIRAGEPVLGEQSMARRRGQAVPLRPGAIAGGPGKLAQALGIDLRFDGAPLYRGELRLTAGAPVASSQIVRSPRVGIGYAEEAVAWPLRFSVLGNHHVSSPRPR